MKHRSAFYCDANEELFPDLASSALEAEFLKAVEGPHAPLVREELEQITERAIGVHNKRRTA